MISFIVIGKNEGWRLDKCLSAIHYFARQEKLANYEIIYVDSKSTDDSLSIAKRNNVDRVLLITGECNAAIGRNVGAKEAKGDILFFLDGDMELSPGFYKDIVDKDEKLIYPFVSGIEIDILHDKSWNYVESKVRRKFKEGIDQFEQTTGGLFVISKELWEKTGGMDNCQKKSQDLDLGLRLASLGFPLCRKGKIWVNHYTQYYAIRTTSLKVVRYSARLARKHFFNIKAQMLLLSSNYSYWILLFCLINSVVYLSFIPMLVYLPVPIYRTYKIIRRTQSALSISDELIKRMKKDFLFLYYFFCFFPRPAKEEYIDVEI